MDQSAPAAQPQSQNADTPVTAVPITRTELVWPGKYNPDGTRREVPRVNLPFQVIETINESRATREGMGGTNAQSPVGQQVSLPEYISPHAPLSNPHRH